MIRNDSTVRSAEKEGEVNVNILRGEHRNKNENTKEKQAGIIESEVYISREVLRFSAGSSHES
jgi:hypothetical protein